MIHRPAFNEVNEQLGSLVAHFVFVLADGRKLGRAVGRDRNVVVSHDRDCLRHLAAAALDCPQRSQNHQVARREYGRHFRVMKQNLEHRLAAALFREAAVEHQLGPVGDPVLLQRLPVAAQPLQADRRIVVAVDHRDMAMPLLDQMPDRHGSSLHVVGRDMSEAAALGRNVDQHTWKVGVVGHFLQVRVLDSKARYDGAVHVPFLAQVAVGFGHLLLGVRAEQHDLVIQLSGPVVDAAQNLKCHRILRSGPVDIRQDHAERPRFLGDQAAGEHIGAIVELFGCFLDFLAGSLVHIVIAVQRSGNGCDGDSRILRQVFYGGQSSSLLPSKTFWKSLPAQYNGKPKTLATVFFYSFFFLVPTTCNGAGACPMRHRSEQREPSHECRPDKKAG
ncbi:hypothetical protein BN871_DK_00030 [Paenibacillus sp. P22]|nr:hypothetical protein BN871_DK_00030 [Paenibacillus sp. P22]